MAALINHSLPNCPGFWSSLCAQSGAFSPQWGHPLNPLCSHSSYWSVVPLPRPLSSPSPYTKALEGQESDPIMLVFLVRQESAERTARACGGSLKKGPACHHVGQATRPLGSG